jgi:alginate O-acetyltransferase complex protein AlgJ
MADAARTIGSGQPAEGGSTPATDAATRLPSLVFLVAVALCLVLPLVQTIYPIFGPVVPPLEERREPSPFPKPHLLLAANGDFAAGLNAWFDDRVGFRDLFVRSKNQIDYSLFRMSRKVYVGRNGWFFSHDEADLSFARLDASSLRKIEESFVALARRLDKKGIRLIVIGYPDKSVIYPEMAPSEMPLVPPGGNYDHFRQFLGSQPSLTFIDAGAIIAAEKRRTSENLYGKTDLHATQAGQLPVVKEIVARIAALEGRPDIHWDEKFTLAHARLGAGSDARFLSPLFPISNDEPYFREQYKIGGEAPDGYWVVPDTVAPERADDGVGRPFDWEFRSLPELCPERLPGMVLFGNSFSDFYWALGLHRYFCFIRRAREPMSRFAKFVNTMPPDTKYFFFEYYAPWLPLTFPPE